jgi:hypothetical protein
LGIRKEKARLVGDQFSVTYQDERKERT